MLGVGEALEEKKIVFHLKGKKSFCTIPMQMSVISFTAFVWKVQARRKLL